MTESQSSPVAAAADELPAQLTYPGRPATPASLTVLRRDRRQRIGRALRALGICWGLAVASVLVPVLHFLLVPGFLIAGPLLASYRWGEHLTVLAVRGECPGCGAAQGIKIGLPPTTRMPLRCESCRRQLILEPGEEALRRR